MLTYRHPLTGKAIYLGKHERRVDARTLHFHKYAKALPEPQADASFRMKVSQWEMYMNDELGCCVISEMGHFIIQVTTYADKRIEVPNSAILKAYEDVGGYVSGDPSTDNGCDMLSALKYFRTTGLGGNKIHSFAAINPQNFTEIKQSVSLFGSVDLGISLPISAQNQTGGVWAVPDSGPVGQGSPGSWGGHCVPIVAYNSNGVYVVTWGAIQFATWNFIKVYADEAYAVVSQQFIEVDGKTPSGLDLASMDADLTAVTA